MKKAALDARVSTDTQKQEGTIQSEIAELRKQIGAAGDALVKEYVDDGYSRARIHRSHGPAAPPQIADAGRPTARGGRGRALPRGRTITKPLKTTGRAPEPGFDARKGERGRSRPIRVTVPWRGPRWP